jgi:exodeoxyribonuclease VII large subunit
VFLAPVRVQGDAAAGEIVKALEALDASAKALEIDTILLARGGGSLEDLWSFNEEAVARAVYKMQTPVICGVGHEVDVTIAELVADRRAATPTAAAELAVPDAMQVRDGLDELAGRLRRALTGDLDRARACLETVLRSVIFRDPTWRVRSASQRLDELTHRLTGGMGQKLASSARRLEPTARRLAAQHPALQAQRARSRLDHTVNKLAWVLGARAKREGDRLGGLEGRLGAVHPKGAIRLARQQLQAAARQLEALSYRSVLKRGFSVTRLEGGTLVRSADQVEPGAVLETQLADGSVRSTAEGGGEKPKPDKPVPAAKPPTRKKPDEPGQGKLF